MDPMRALDMELRTGISHNDVDDFANRMDLVCLCIQTFTMSPIALGG